MLIRRRCLYCGLEISHQDTVCPHCGRALTSLHSNIKHTLAWTVAKLLGLVILLKLCWLLYEYMR
ncbi:MAG: hypothetical protein M3347_14105 [Armatimonadota bacterium]|nr:hypothetical protein [Armatimonadota bacterium]